MYQYYSGLGVEAPCFVAAKMFDSISGMGVESEARIAIQIGQLSPWYQ